MTIAVPSVIAMIEPSATSMPAMRKPRAASIAAMKEQDAISFDCHHVRKNTLENR